MPAHTLPLDHRSGLPKLLRLQAARLPINKLMIKTIRKMKKSTFAIPAAALATRPNPKRPAMIAITRKTQAYQSMAVVLSTELEAHRMPDRLAGVKWYESGVLERPIDAGVPISARESKLPGTLLRSGVSAPGSFGSGSFLGGSLFGGSLRAGSTVVVSSGWLRRCMITALLSRIFGWRAARPKARAERHAVSCPCSHVLLGCRRPFAVRAWSLSPKRASSAFSHRSGPGRE